MPTMVHGLTQGVLSESERKEILSTSAGKVLKNATKSLNKSKSELVVRDIQPAEDLGQSNAHWDLNVSASDQFDEVINKELDDGKFLVISAVEVADANPDTSFIQFSSGATTIQEVGLEPSYVQDQPVTYLKSPVVYDENDTIKISLYSESTGDKNIILHGFIAETEGEVISPGDAS